MPRRSFDDDQESGWDDGLEDDQLLDEEENEDDEEYEEEDLEDLEEDDDEEGSTGIGTLEDILDEGIGLVDNGDYQEAVEVFREATERFPEEPAAFFHLGQAAMMLLLEEVERSHLWEDDAELMGYYEEASAAFEEALSLDEDYVPALNSMGALYALRENFKSAVECWERSLDIDPDQEEVRKDLDTVRGRLEG